MKKTPLLLIAFLILLVVILGLTDSDNSGKYGNHGERDALFSRQPVYVSKDLPSDDPSSVSADRAFPMDERLFLTENIRKSDRMVVQLRNAVERLKNDGNDVEVLEEEVDDYSLLVSEARDYLSNADESSSSSDQQKYLALSREKMVRADNALKGIFTLLQSYSPGPVAIAANDSLFLNGSGIIILSGDLDVELNMSTGKFSVVDFAGDLEIDADELYGPEMLSEAVIPSDNPQSPHSIVSYINVRGNVTMSGSSLNVAVMSDNVHALVKGTGEAELYGNGTYYLNNATMDREGNWISPLFEI